MKLPNNRQGGAVLVFAVLLLAAGVFVLAGIAQLAATQSLVGQREWEAVTQRVTLENSRAMARQFMLARMFSNVVSTNSFAYTTNWGGFSISNISGPSAGLYWNAASTNAGQIVNPFNPMERGGFYPGVARARLVSEITATNTNTNNTVNWDFLVRTRSPIAAGYNYVQQYPGTKDFPSETINYISVGTNIDRRVQFKGRTDAADIPNVPVSSTTSTNSDDGNGYQGSFAVAGSAVVPPAFEGSFSVEAVDDPISPTSLRVVVDLAIDGFALLNSDEGLALRYVVPQQLTFTNTDDAMVTTNVTELRITGSTDGFTQPALQIVLTNHPYLTNIIISGSNPSDTGRRVYLHLASMTQPVAVSASTDHPPSSRWRLGISVKDCSNFEVSNLSGVTLVGGIRINSDGPSLNVESEYDPGGLDYIADQMMWLEDYRAP